MSLTAELFGSSAVSLPLPEQGTATATKAAISFEPTKKAAFDLFAVAPQVKKPTRKEKQRLRLLGPSLAKEERKKIGGEGGSDAILDILPSTVLSDETAEDAWASKKTRAKHLRHSLHENKEEESRTVFVGNLANDVQRRVVAKVFQGCGAIECVRVRAQALGADGEDTGKDTNGQPKNVGRAIRVLRGDIKKGDQYSAVAYVLFKEKASVAEALKRNGVVVGGRHIVVTAMDLESRAYAPETSVFVGNISYDTSEEMVWSFFVEKGIADVKRVRLVRDRDTGKCKGFGYVEFHAAASVPMAIALRGNLLDGREMRIVHTQKSKAVTAAATSRREKRKRDMQPAKTTQGSKKARKEMTHSSAQRANAMDQPSWMGVATNPRKKIPKDLRPLVEGKGSRPASGPRPPVKRKMRNPEK